MATTAPTNATKNPAPKAPEKAPEPKGAAPVSTAPEEVTAKDLLAAQPAKPAPKSVVAVTSNIVPPWTPEKVGEQLYGTYLGLRWVPAPSEKRQPFKTHIFQLADGVSKVCVASAMLNSKMEQIPPNTECWVTYTGKFNTSNGVSNNYDVVVPEGTELLSALESGAK